MFHNLMDSRLTGRKNKSTFRIDFTDSYDYVLEKTANLTYRQSRNISVPITGCTTGNLTAIGEQDGSLKLLRNESLDLLYHSKIHGGIVNDAKFRPNYNNHLLTGSTDCSALLYDIEMKKRLTSVIDIEQCTTIRTLEFYDSFHFATGTKQGNICLWDTRERSRTRPIQSIYNAHFNIYDLCDVYKVVTGIVFNYLRYMYSCCSNDSFIRVWDLRFNKNNSSRSLVSFSNLKYNGPSPRIEGFTCLTLDDQQNLYAAATDNKIYRYKFQSLFSTDYSNNDHIQCFAGPAITNYTKIAVINDLRLLVTGSSDAEVCVYQLDKSKNEFVNYPTIMLPHQIEEVSVVVCNKDNYEIISFDDANNVYKWVINSKLNNLNPVKYRRGRVSEKYPKMRIKRFNPKLSKIRKRYLSGNYNEFAKEDELMKPPNKRSRSVLELTN